MRVGGEVELDLGGERHRGCRERLGCAWKRHALERGLRVDVHIARVGRPARAEWRARATRVVLVLVKVVLCACVVRAREGEDGVVMCKEIGFGDGEFEVEDIEELTLDPTDITLAEDPGAECPVDILECRVIQVLRGKKVREDQ